MFKLFKLFTIISYRREKMRGVSSCQTVVEQKCSTMNDLKMPKLNHLRQSTQKRRTWESVLTMAVVIPLIFALFSSPIDPVAYKYSNKTMPELVGVLAVNNGLQNASKLRFQGDLVGPEAFTVDQNGHLYSGLKDGRIVKINVTDESYTVISSISESPYFHCDSPGEKCSRPLGLDFDPSGNLIVADPFTGLLKINVTTGERTLLSGGESSSFAAFNNLAVLPNGSIFVTKFCQRNNFALEVFEGIPSGKLLQYNPVTNTLHTVVPDLFLPNGVSVSNDGESVLVSETGRARILRYYIKGTKAGQTEVFADNLPGLPDNIQPSSKGGYWVAFPNVRDSQSLDFFAENAWLRRILVHFRAILPLIVPQHVMVARLDEDGTILETLHDHGAQTLHSISEAFEYNNELLIGSFEAPFIGKLTLKHH